jgi:predicted acyl esterase
VRGKYGSEGEYVMNRPLYDRNPQTFVKSIFWAKPEDFKKATQRIYNTSFIELPLVSKN